MEIAVPRFGNVSRKKGDHVGSQVHSQELMGKGKDLRNKAQGNEVGHKVTLPKGK